MRRTAAALVLLIAGLASVTAQRRQPTLLPSFEVTTIDERPVVSGELAMEDNWLLVFLRPDCPLCDLILQVAGSSDHPQIGQRMIVVQAGVSPRQLKTIAAQFPGLPRTVWHADPQLQAAHRLQFTRLPVIVGVRDRSIEWTLAGVLLDSTTLESLLVNWLAR